MQVTRRDLALAGALALCAQGLLFGTAAHAETEAAAVDQAVEALRRALLTADQAELEKLTAGQVSYGHSDGKVQTKAEFIEGVVTRKAVVKSLTFPELKVAVVGGAAVARHVWLSESETDGKPTTTRIGVLQVWQKQDGNWKLLARQGYKLA
jgi:Domain of unknown function (DUF4440)